MTLVFISLTLFVVQRSYGQSVTVDLTGQWTVLNVAKGINISGTVPGSMYTAMYYNNMTADPLYRDNDVKLRWMALDDWTYTRNFQISADILQSGTILLVCDGLDTISTVYINNQKVGTSESMFLQYVYDIRWALKKGNNLIRIDFQSAVRIANERANASSYPLPNTCNAIENGECHGNFVRKAAYSFTWNGGPSFPTQGIWKKVYIQAFSTAVIRQLAVIIRESTDGGWIMDATVSFNINGNSVTGKLDTNIVGLPIWASQTVTLTPNNKTLTYIVYIPGIVYVERWWPNGYGNQTLYTLNVTFYDWPYHKEVSNKQCRVGFRSVGLVQVPVGTNQGSTFYFQVNGLPVFLKGASLMPVDSFQETLTRERYWILLKSAAEANMNTIRLNGHGIYENDDFYDIADELGILVWQDLMFSIGLYPVTADFSQTVTQEVTYQVRRLKYHPSIIQWAGNNECELALRSNWYGIKQDKIERYYKDYIELYVTTLKPILDREDPTRTYFTSCPSNGDEDEKEGWIAKDPGSDYFGDIHFYDFRSDMWNISFYRIPRLATEYGLMSWSGVEDLEDVFSPSDWDYWGAMASHRQHYPDGNQLMVTEMEQHFIKPNTTDKKQFFKDMIYLSQIGQAVGIQAESEHFRRWQNQLTSDGRGQTMGAIYWQLHSLWQAPTWASIDYNGKWRMLHYYAKRFFAPVIVSAYLDGNAVTVYVVVDEIPVKEVKDTRTGVNQFVPVTNYTNKETMHLVDKANKVVTGTLFIDGYTWDSFTPICGWNYHYVLRKSSQIVFVEDAASLVNEANCPDRNRCFLHIYINGRNSGISTYLPLSYYKDARGLAKANIKIIDVQHITDTEFIITLTSNRIAPFVWLDAYRVPGRFSDNGFLMLTPTRTVNFTSWNPVDRQSLKQSLTVKSLMDVYV